MKRQDSITTAALTLTLLLAMLVPTTSWAEDAGLMQRSASAGATERRAEDLFAEARLHAELGGHAAAAAAYLRIFEDQSQPAAVRGRARLGQGVMLREQGDHEEWVACFFQALEIALETEDLELAHELIAAAGGVALSVGTWHAVLPLLAFDRAENDEGQQGLVLPPELRRRSGLVQSSPPIGAELTVRSEYTGEPISIAFKDAELQDLFRMFAQISGLNIVWAKELEGETITLDVTDVPWDQVMALVMKTNELGSSFEGNVLRIAPLGQLAREQDQALALKQAQELAGPARSIARTMQFADGQLALERVRAQLSARGSVRLDLRTNTLIVEDLAPRVDAIEELLNELDVETTSDGAFSGQPISVSFKDADLKDLFAMLGAISGLEFVLDDRVKGTADLAVSDEPWDSVLHGLLGEHELAWIGVDGRHYVFPRPADDVQIAEFRSGDERVRLGRPEGGW